MNLYIVSSPLHIFLTLLNQKDHSSSLCILIDEENKLGKYYSLISQVFKHSVYINFRYNRISKYFRFSKYTRCLFKDFRFLKDKAIRDKVENIHIQ